MPPAEPLLTLGLEARQAGFAYYRRTGIYPINHAVVVRDDVLAATPALATGLVALFEAAKAPYLAQLAAGAAASPADDAAREVSRLVAGDPFPYGLAANRKAIEAIVAFAADQQVIPRKLGLEELFAPGTLGSL